MLTAEENERLTRVGPGTPMGNLMRWYWHPIAASAQLAENPVRRVRILGEDLVLYRDTLRHIGATGLPCNWLQCMENGGDPQHGIYLHGHFYRYVLEGLEAEVNRRPPKRGTSSMRTGTAIARSASSPSSTASGNG